MVTKDRSSSPSRHQSVTQRQLRSLQLFLRW
ncbi:hypothetical protein COLO4_28580 [Corchorus olitorius]|uniref:Uncharacterized protein n=1 Tax=Corchorus olitorius TaxID=93759 RepID=A0A1R3HJL4_9ROSI|nr:hypothetical protein COLO4_28580 [Corchorus olitorius]